MSDAILFPFSVAIAGGAIGWLVAEIYYTIRARIRAKRSSKMTRADEFNDPRR